MYKRQVKDGRLKTKDIKNDTIIFKGEDNLHYEKFQDGTVKCIEDEIPFEVPEGWAWERMQNLTCKIGAGSTPTGGNSVYSQSGIKFIRSQNVYEDGLILDDIAYISEEINKKKSGSIVKPKDILLNITGGSIGRCALVPDDFDIGNVNQHVLIVRLVNLELRSYIHLLITSSYIQKQICDKQVGSGRGGLSAATFSSFLMPIPPENEQSKIQGFVSNILEKVISINTEKLSLKELIDKSKAQILDLAIRGKLVPQNPNDEPASVLLERIRAEKEELIKAGKIKRDKKESIIFRGEDNSYYEKVGAEIRCIDSEIPFEIPDGWIYERLGNICSIARGGSPRPIENYLTDDENGLNWIKIGDAEQGGKYIYSTKEKIRPEGLSKTRYVCRGDFLLTNSMSFGRPYILRTNGCIHDGWLVIGGIEIAFHQDYLYYMLSSSIMYNALSSLAVGSTVKNLKSDSVKSLLVPIPPLAEQACISRQIENYFATMLQIERSLS